MRQPLTDNINRLSSSGHDSLVLKHLLIDHHVIKSIFNPILNDSITFLQA